VSALSLCPVASGSRGNAYLVGEEGSWLLVDCGISARRLGRALDGLGIFPGSLEAILITHEHRDHVAGLRVFRKKCDAPLYATRGTLASIPDPGPGRCRPIEPGRPFAAGSFRIRPFAVLHDAAEPVGFVIEGNSGSVGIATDLGRVGEEVLEAVAGVRALVLESNHDEEMLENGAYPWYLKERIRGDRGHLSNRASQSALLASAHDSLDAVILAHLSAENNRIEIAREGAEGALRNGGYGEIPVMVAEQDGVPELLEFD